MRLAQSPRELSAPMPHIRCAELDQPWLNPIMSKESQPGHEYRDLDFSYIHDPEAEDHAELMAGEPATAYEVKREVWTPDNKDLFKDFSFERHERVAAFQWLESRLHRRCQ